jgi:hypothetical protein
LHVLDVKYTHDSEVAGASIVLSLKGAHQLLPTSYYLINVCVPIDLQIPAFAGYKIFGLLRGTFFSGGSEVKID